MITLTELTKAYEDGKALYEAMLEDHEAAAFRTTEEYGSDPVNTVSLGDNLDHMMYLLKEKDMAGKIQLIYVDPPFFSSGKNGFINLILFSLNASTLSFIASE